MLGPHRYADAGTDVDSDPIERHRLRQRAVDADPHGPQAHGPVEGDHHVGVVREGGGHAVAGRDPEVSQGVGGPVGLPVQVRVRQAARTGWAAPEA